MQKGIIIFFILITSAGFAQTTKATALPNALDQQYTPDNSSGLFNLVTPQKSFYNNEQTIKNVLTYDIGLMFRSVASVNYERVLFKYMSAKVGLGLTYARDMAQTGFSEIGLVKQQYNNYETSFPDILKKCDRSNAGIFLSGGLKFYPDGNAPKELFLQINATYSQYNLKIADAEYNGWVNNGNWNMNSPNKEQIKTYSCTFNVGRQYMLGSKNVKFLNTWYVGFGIRGINYDKLEYVYISQPYGYPTAGYYTFNGTRNVLTPTISFGYCLGLGF